MNSSEQIVKIKNTLLIIDAYGFVFRAFHVLPSLISPDGLEVGAVYGFTSMLLKVLNNFKPNHVVIVFDAGGKNFRHQIYSEYKSHRPPVPEDLINQFDFMRDVASSLNFPIFEKKGYEADDIIATMSTIAASLEEDVIIISSDKDMMQLINDRIKMYDPMKDKYISRENVIEKFGVGPEKVREVMALIGDKSDNIPGIHGIGPKTASTYIQQFGSVKGLIESVETISNIRHRKMINDSKDIALMSWELVGLDCEIDLEFNIDSLKFIKPASIDISKFLIKYGFKSLYKRVEDLFNIKIIDNTVIPPSVKKEIIIQELHTEEEIASLIDKIESKGVVSVYLTKYEDQVSLILAIDNRCFIVNSVIANENSAVIARSEAPWQSHASVVMPFEIATFSSRTGNDKTLTWLLENKSIKKITWNLKNLLKFFGSSLASCDDIELMQYSIGVGKIQNDIFQEISNKLNAKDFISSLAEIIVNFQKNYNDLLADLIKNNSLHLYQEIDLPLSNIIYKMELAGVKLDTNYLNQLSIEFGDQINKLELEIFRAAGTEFNIASPKQLGVVLFEKMQLPFGKISSKTKTYSTKAEILEKLSDSGVLIGDLLLKWRMLSKLKNTYTDTLPNDINNITGRVHTSFLQTSTNTGRLSSQNPNLQNVPIRSIEGNKIRAAFIPESGYKLISADYSQIELRILSDLANVTKLKEAFTSGIDIHTQTACQIFNISIDQVTSEYRRKAKTINFGIIYGISPFGLAKQLNISSSQAADYIKKYFEEYSNILEYMENTKIYAREHGYVYNFFGRKCFINTINDKNHTIRQFAERAAINAPLQSTSADIIKIAMINLDNKITELKLQTKLVLQIHDELLFESPINEIEIIIPIIKSIMQEASPLSVPMVVNPKVGDNWMETH